MVSMLRDRYFHYKNIDSELVLSDGNIESFRVTEYVLRKLKDYFGDILARYGRSFDDVERIQHTDLGRPRMNVSLTVEQFLRFGDCYVWDSGPGFWSFKGKDFAITGYITWDFVLNRFTWLTGEDYTDSGQVYEGKNEFHHGFDLVYWNTERPKIEYAVINSERGKRYCINAEAFMHPSTELYRIMKKSGSVAVMTERGWAVFGLGMGSVVDLTYLDDPEYVPLKDDAWGIYVTDSEHRHSWLPKHTGKPTEAEIRDGIRAGIECMLADWAKPPHRLFWFDHPCADCVILFADSDDKHFDCEACSAYLQPHFGEFVHVFSRKDFKYYFDFAKVITCVYDSGSRMLELSGERYGRCGYRPASDPDRSFSSVINSRTISEFSKVGIPEVRIDPAESDKEAGFIYVMKDSLPEDPIPVLEKLRSRIRRRHGPDVFFAIIDESTYTGGFKRISMQM